MLGTAMLGLPGPILAIQRDESSVSPRSHATIAPATTAKRNSPAFLPEAFDVVVDGLSGLFRQLERHDVASLLLAYRCSIDRIPT
jgi:hypothetical protein